MTENLISQLNFRSVGSKSTKTKYNIPFAKSQRRIRHHQDLQNFQNQGHILASRRDLRLGSKLKEDQDEELERARRGRSRLKMLEERREFQRKCRMEEEKLNQVKILKDIELREKQIKQEQKERFEKMEQWKLKQSAKVQELEKRQAAEEKRKACLNAEKLLQRKMDLKKYFTDLSRSKASAKKIKKIKNPEKVKAEEVIPLEKRYNVAMETKQPVRKNFIPESRKTKIVSDKEVEELAKRIINESKKQCEKVISKNDVNFEIALNTWIEDQDDHLENEHLQQNDNKIPQSSINIKAECNQLESIEAWYQNQLKALDTL